MTPILVLVIIGTVVITLSSSSEKHRPLCHCTPDRMYGGILYDCRKMGLDEIPEHIGRNATTIDLRGNNITILKNYSFVKMPLLKCLLIGENRIEKLEEHSLFGVRMLEVLNLANNKLHLSNDSYPQHVFSYLPVLKELDIRGNSRTEEGSYPDDVFADLTSVEVLVIDGFMETIFGPGFKNMTSLKTLKLTGTSQMFMFLYDESFINIPTIEYLDLTGCPIGRMDADTLKSLVNLTSLTLKNTKYLTLESTFKTLKAFEGRHMSLLDFTGVYQSLPNGNFTFRTITKEILKPLTNLCVDRLSLADNWQIYLDNQAFEDTVLASCLTHLDVSRNMFIDEISLLFLLPMLTKLEYFNISNQYRWTGEEYSGLRIHNYKQEKTPVDGNFAPKIYPRPNYDHRRHTQPSQIYNYKQDKPPFHKNFALNIYRHPNYDHSEHKQPFQLRKRLEISFFTEFPTGNSVKNDISKPVDGWKSVVSPVETFEDDEANFESTCGIKYVFSLPASIKALDMSKGLSSAGYTNLCITFNNTHYIEEFYASNVDFKHKFYRMAGWERLEKIDLSGNEFGFEIPYYFQNFVSLKYVNLCNTKLGVRSLSKNILAGSRNLSTLLLCRNIFQDIPAFLMNFPQLKTLDMSYNMLSYISKSDRVMFDTLNARHPFTLKLRGNNFLCGCETLDFINWLSTTHVELDNYGDYYCVKDDAIPSNVSYILSNYLMVWRRCIGRTSFYYSLCSTVTLALIVTLSWIIMENKTKLKHFFMWLAFGRVITEPTRRDYSFDAYVGYCEEDWEFVCLRMRNVMEQETGLKLFLRERDTHVSLPIADEIIRGIYCSWTTVLLLTPNFLEDTWMKFIIDRAIFETRYMPRRLVVVLVGDVCISSLPFTLLDVVPEDNIIVMSEIVSGLDGEDLTCLSHIIIGNC